MKNDSQPQAKKTNRNFFGLANINRSSGYNDRERENKQNQIVREPASFNRREDNYQKVNRWYYRDAPDGGYEEL